MSLADRGVGDGVGVGVGVAVGVEVGIAVGDTVAVEEAVGVEDAVGVGVLVGELVDVGVLIAIGVDVPQPVTTRTAAMARIQLRLFFVFMLIPPDSRYQEWPRTSQPVGKRSSWGQRR